jgi:hypothetical protein
VVALEAESGVSQVKGQANPTRSARTTEGNGEPATFLAVWPVQNHHSFLAAFLHRFRFNAAIFSLASALIFRLPGRTGRCFAGPAPFNKVLACSGLTAVVFFER